MKGNLARSMAIHALTENFNRFSANLNPKGTFEEIASREYRSIKGLIEDKSGPAAVLSPNCFLQGSYKQATAIYTINDIDIVALCRLWYPGGGTGKRWSRDEIFDAVAAPLRADKRYEAKTHYGPQSMCIKVDLGIRIEVLPVVLKAGNNDPSQEPFCLYRPEKGSWQEGYARFHQAYLSLKNQDIKTGGNFIPSVKVLKHLRSLYGLQSVSFHLECLLYVLPDDVFAGGAAEFIAGLLAYIARFTAEEWYEANIWTPCGDRKLFFPSEWSWESWSLFHRAARVWSAAAIAASTEQDRNSSISRWQELLGREFFPRVTG